MFTTAEIKKRLTKAFSSLQENVYKGKLTHSEEIQAFQKYFETVYNPMELVQTVCYAASILKEKFEKQIAKKKFPNVVKPEFKYDLAFESVERKVVKREKPVAKASLNTASKPTTSSSQGAPSAKDAAPEKIKKSSKGSGKPPLTPKKRKVPTENVILVEDDEEETPPTPLKKKQKQNKATITPYQTNKQQGVEINILPPSSKETQSQPSGGAALEHIGSNASDPEAQQNEQETSSPDEDGKKDSKKAEEKDSEEKEDYEDTSSNSPPRVTFPSDYADKDDQDSDEIEGYFQQDEDMSEGEADPEGN
ncbi:uncharacterized protein LOC127131466 [Lathyrus oleraceus]|uniref:uncharacterized protein LOC127131466 n=1 Tax=Pisum sativum TaxID=3888 RepID=UPI0021CFBA83|nr:uncharacterized protein LOC127131466 [Pisum sativum]